MFPVILTVVFLFLIASEITSSAGEEAHTVLLCPKKEFQK
jgi:hypothetical protein